MYKRQAQSALDINALMGAMVHYAQLELHQAQVTVRLELAEALPTILADDLQIQLVVLYLMRNAIEAMSETNDRLRELTLRTALLDTDTVLVTVHDTGQGPGAEETEHLFQPFVTTKPSGMAVSYTHLDVYKRQAYGAMGRWHVGAGADGGDRAAPASLAGAYLAP